MASFRWLSHGLLFNSIYGNTTQGPPTRTSYSSWHSEHGFNNSEDRFRWSHGHESHYTHAVYGLVSGIGDIMSLPCQANRMDKSEKRCFLFHVYGWFFGLALGAIATIYCFVENDTLAAKVNMSAAVGFSILVACGQIAINGCGSPYLDKSCRKRASAVIRLSGLMLIMVAIAAGTFSSNGPDGLFFLCAIFSLACYLMATIGFTVRLCHELKRDSARRRDSSASSSIRDREELRASAASGRLDMGHPVWAPEVSVVFHSDNDYVGLSPGIDSGVRGGSNELSVDPLPILKLPSYSEAVEESNGSPPPHSPPAYSYLGTEVTLPSTPCSTIQQPHQCNSTTDQQAGNVLPVAEADNPPDYQEIAQEQS